LTIHANNPTKLDRPMTLRQHSNAIHRRPPEHQQNRATFKINLLLLLLKDKMGWAPKEEKRRGKNLQERDHCQDLNSNGNCEVSHPRCVCKLDIVGKCSPTQLRQIKVFINYVSHRRYPYFDVVVGLVWSHDPKSYAGGGVCYW
jgi:hypothetical protein